MMTAINVIGAVSLALLIIVLVKDSLDNKDK